MPSTIVAVPRVGESPVSFECRAIEVRQLRTAAGMAIDSWLTLGEVVAIHIARSSLKDGAYDSADAGHVSRGGGPADDFEIGPDLLFRLYRPR